jgi:hypothetical protein
MNPKITPDTSMYQAKVFSIQTVLICCFWSVSIAELTESDWVDPYYLTHKYHSKGDYSCIADVLFYYGIKIKVVQTYKDAILKLQTGFYYATWIICGSGTGELPIKGANVNLVGQFVQSVDTFWKSGGAVVWWCDNDPLFYELNLFLEIAEFPDNGKSKLRIGPGSDGKQCVKPGNLRSDRIQVFNNQLSFDFKLYNRPSFAHNLVAIYEGVTISNAKDPFNIDQFVSFSYDSKGGISSLFYLSDYEQPRGDIIIDCGFTKLFNELTPNPQEGTLRYIQNIAALTGQYEKHFLMFGENGKRIFRPVLFKQDIDESVTIYNTNDHLNIDPFVPFSYDSKRGIS